MTLPTRGMRRAMMTAAVGDDVLGEDPSVRELEERAAELMGKEAGLFVASGTMANQLAAMTFCQRGDEVIVAEGSHIFNLEVGGLAALHGLQARPLPTSRGVFPLEALAEAMRPSALQVAGTRLLCLENTFDLNHGYTVSGDAMRAMARTAHARGIPVYLDGARIFNAASALQTSPADLAASVDAAMFCLSKGLACPVGSILVGETAFIAKARRNRQRLGGGWRQAGVLAAAGLVALAEMVGRVADDNHLARRLAESLARVGFELAPGDCETNIVFVPTPPGVPAVVFASRMASKGVRVKVIGTNSCRMVVHKDVSERDLKAIVRAAVAAIRVHME